MSTSTITGSRAKAVVHLFRMLDAAEFKGAADTSAADFALLTSEAFYEEVISHGQGLIDPDVYEPITIRGKETRGRAWLYLPDVRHSSVRKVTGRKRRPPPAGDSTRAQGAGHGGSDAHD